MIEFKKILVTTDLSENSNAAMPYAAELARRYNGTLELLYVFEDILYFPTAPEPGSYAIDPVQIMESARGERNKQLELAAKLFSELEKVKVKPVLLEGHPPSQIVKYATEQKADCLVVATHG